MSHKQNYQGLFQCMNLKCLTLLDLKYVKCSLVKLSMWSIGQSVMWRCCGVLEYSLDSHAESPGSNLTMHRHAHMSFSKAIYPHCSRPRCVNGDLVGIADDCVWIGQCHYYRLLYQARNAPRGVEIVHCKCGIEMYPITGVIIICCKLFGPLGKDAYKN